MIQPEVVLRQIVQHCLTEELGPREAQLSRKIKCPTCKQFGIVTTDGITTLCDCATLTLVIERDSG